MLAALLLAAAALLATPAAARECTADTFAEAVDQAGEALRRYNAEAQPELNRRLEALSARKGWSEAERDAKFAAYLDDPRLNQLDAQANELLDRVDRLGRPEADGTFDCSRLAELEAASAELLAVMKAKSANLNAKIDQELGTAGTTVAQTDVVAAAKPEANGTGAPQPAAAGTGANLPADKAATTKAAAEAVADKAKSAPRADTSWDTTTARLPADAWDTAALDEPAPVIGEPYGPAPAVSGAPHDDGYTIDEIREATRGFFGTISTSLASVIEHAFASVGRPTAYILGTEGGGAFLAGLRYGSGTLYLRSGGTAKVYWHGPTLGYDVGAEGGRTLILIYKLTEPRQLYRSYSGIDGSAYFVGGVGMTLLKRGDVVMAPIRSGLGLRLGANIGYLRFTDRPTWNPF